MFKMAYNFCTQMKFENRLEISIAIGNGNYCANNYNGDQPLTSPYSDEVKERSCKNCEVAVFDENGEFMKIDQFLPDDVSSDGTVAGWVSADNVAKIINSVANWNKQKCDIDGCNCTNNKDCEHCSTASYYNDPQGSFDR